MHLDELNQSLPRSFRHAKSITAALPSPHYTVSLLLHGALLRLESPIPRSRNFNGARIRTS